MAQSGGGDNKLGSDYAKLKLLGGQFLFLVTLVINLATSIGVVWLIFRLSLNKIDPLEPIIQLDHQASFDRFVLNRDLSADSLIVQDKLSTNMIDHEQVSFVGVSGDIETGAQAEISLNSDYVSMQADSIGPGPDEDYSFWLQQRVSELEVSNGIRNVRAIRAPLGSERYYSEDEGSQMGGLEMSSPDGLELSGNRGVGVHSRRISVRSGESISLESKEESVHLQGRYLLMPSLEHYSILSATDERGSIADRHQLCYNKDTGQLFRSRAACSSD